MVRAPRSGINLSVGPGKQSKRFLFLKGSNYAPYPRGWTKIERKPQDGRSTLEVLEAVSRTACRRRRAGVRKGKTRNYLSRDRSRQCRSQGGDRLTVLPTELLITIFELLIPCDRIYHFETTENRHMKLEYSVHKITPKGCCDSLCEDPVLDESSMVQYALACRRLRDLVYDMFYGRNQFVADVGNSPTYRRRGLVWADDLTDQEGSLPSSWSDALCFLRGPMYPLLTASILQYIVRLSICVHLEEHTTIGKFRGILSKLRACFDDKPDLDRRVTRDLTIAVAPWIFEDDRNPSFEIGLDRGRWVLRVINAWPVRILGPLEARQCLYDDAVALQYLEPSPFDGEGL